MRTPLLFSLAAFAALLPAAHATVIAGSSGTINGSTVASFVDLTASHLNSVGFKLSGTAVRSPGTAPAEVFLAVPAAAWTTGFTVMGIEWNPLGHEPPGIYDKPHFDLHFYYIPDSQRMMIPGGVVGSVDPNLLPSGYSQPGPTVPMMGGHSVDLTAPEWTGGTFGQTFIYGFFEGKEIFLEPMVTQAYFEAMADGSTSFAIRQPGTYGQAVVPDFVPTRVTYAYDSASDTYTISLGNFAAVPEPATLAIFAIPGIFALRRARKR